MSPALFALTLAVFAIGTTEFAIMGLLPEVAAGLGVSIPQAGLLVTGYALGVAIGGPLVAVATNPLERKSALLILIGLFVVGHILTAVAPSYGWVLTGRIVTSFCHGSFVGIASVVAVSLVPKDRQAMAIAVVWAGFSASSIIGVPAGTALGQALGWRATFWAIALLGALAAAMIALTLPRQSEAKRDDLAAEFHVLTRPQVWLTLALSVLACGSAFAVYTYIAPLLISVTGIPAANIPAILLAFGIGGTIGILAGAKLADRSLVGTIIGVFAANTLLHLALLLTVHNAVAAVATIFVWGFLFYAPAAAIQLRLIRAASEGPNLASTLNQSAFNAGNAIGPMLGAAALTAGLGYAWLPWLGAAMAALGLAIAILSATLDRKALASPA